MTDLISPEKRSHIMSMIRSKNTKPELIVRRFLFQHGFRFRINVRRLPGTPDIVLRKYHTAIFVNGCFWHHHEGCRYAFVPKTRTDFWLAKFRRNRVNDTFHRESLEKMGWHVIVIWECEIKADFEVAMNRVASILHQRRE